MRWTIGVIYFLIKDKKIIYIGQTTNLKHRLQNHRVQFLEWDEVKTVQYPIERLNEMEAIWIQYFKPEYNCQHKHETIVKTKTTIKSYKKPMKFRKLTEKSFLDFGLVKSLTVGQLLKEGKKLQLAKMYYSLSHITFFDNILDEIGISEEWRIQKPGVDKEKFYSFGLAIHPEAVQKIKKQFVRKVHEGSKNKLKHIAMNNGNKMYHKKFNQQP